MIYPRKEIANIWRQNTRKMNQLAEHLIELKEDEGKSWRLYLGEPLYLQLINTQSEIDMCYFRALEYDRYEK